MIIDPSSGRALYRQLADVIRTQIGTGELGPGQRLPAQTDYMHGHGVSRDTVERAMVLLRSEGLIVYDGRGRGYRVRPQNTTAVLVLGRGKVSARMPTEPERRQHGIEEGVPVLLITRDNQTEEEMYPADQVKIQVEIQAGIQAGLEPCPRSSPGEANPRYTKTEG
jgi:DNA-binding GntR family transcriptional regulator